MFSGRGPAWEGGDKQGAQPADRDLGAQETNQSGCFSKLSFGFPELAREGSPSFLPTLLFHLAPKGLASKSPL